jgi:uncharacterized DUF497 family protein
MGSSEGKLNERKHGISFEEATTAFRGPLSMTAPDLTHSTTEYRFVTFGLSSRARLLTVSHTERGESIRLITARKSTKQERKIYEES